MIKEFLERAYDSVNRRDEDSMANAYMSTTATLVLCLSSFVYSPRKFVRSLKETCI